jgi:hypothetical protein
MSHVMFYYIEKINLNFFPIMDVIRIEDLNGRLSIDQYSAARVEIKQHSRVKSTKMASRMEIKRHSRVKSTKAAPWVEIER